MAYPIYTPNADLYRRVDDELERQRSLKEKGKFPWTCEDGIPRLALHYQHAAKLAVLAEEFGEVSREVTEGLIASRTDTTRLRNELVQVMAVCAAWIRCIDR